MNQDVGVRDNLEASPLKAFPSLFRGHLYSGSFSEIELTVQSPKRRRAAPGSFPPRPGWRRSSPWGSHHPLYFSPSQKSKYGRGKPSGFEGGLGFHFGLRSYSKTSSRSKPSLFHQNVLDDICFMALFCGSKETILASVRDRSDLCLYGFGHVWFWGGSLP